MLLVAVLACAVIRPWGWPEAVVAVPAAGVVVATGALSPHRGLGRGAAARAGARLPGRGAGAGPAVRRRGAVPRLRGVDGPRARRAAAAAAGRGLRVASVITAVLSLDATVVLLTPVVFATAARLGARAKPHVYACTHLSNSASLLLPVSNLTNLLAFAASGLTFTRFAGADGAAVAGRHRRRVRRLPPVLPLPTWTLGARALPTAEPVEFPVFVLVVLGVHAGRVRRHLGGWASTRRGRPPPARRCSPPAPWPGGAPRVAAIVRAAAVPVPGVRARRWASWSRARDRQRARRGAAAG